MNEIYYSERNKRLFKKALTHSNQQLAAPLERFCAKLLGDCKVFDPEFFSCTTSRYLLGWHLEVSGALCILFVIFVEIYNCFRRKKCASERITFDSSPVFEISFSAALLNTLCYPYNTLEHISNAFLALYLAQG